MGEVKPDTSPLSFKCEDLIHKREYKFRVRAVSKIGPSEPASFPKVVIAKDPWGEFALQCTNSNKPSLSLGLS